MFVNKSYSFVYHNAKPFIAYDDNRSNLSDHLTYVFKKVAHKDLNIFVWLYLGED